MCATAIERSNPEVLSDDNRTSAAGRERSERLGLNHPGQLEKSTKSTSRRPHVSSSSQRTLRALNSPCSREGFTAWPPPLPAARLIAASSALTSVARDSRCSPPQRSLRSSSCALLPAASVEVFIDASPWARTARVLLLSAR
ncbi:hypothetical protein MUK42_36645 [Musa troglodytarum]|uniref:Uncharacterized protein n=1 Tax=Musa troglodytarum TaxID=320322 RepID=A0A9E7GDW5_9LILI|nr:hypothetical protein MUK42_36645 [Musa troglodytarum]